MPGGDRVLGKPGPGCYLPLRAGTDLFLGISYGLVENDFLLRLELQLFAQRIPVYSGSHYCGQSLRGAEQIDIFSDYPDIGAYQELVVTRSTSCL